MLEQNSRVDLPNENNVYEHNIWTQVNKHKVFKIQPNNMLIQPLDPYLWDTWNTRVFTSNLKWKETTPKHFDACQTVRNNPRTFKKCDSQLSDVSVCVFIQVEEILSLCCLLWLDSNSIPVRFWTCIMSAVSEILHS